MLAACFLLAGPVLAQKPTLLLRFPDIHGNKVVFTYAGDLWIAPVSGGTATRLTAHPGLELFARFSPDGSQIAFTGQYDGDEQVYVIPATGGVPRQLTFYPAEGPLPPRWGYDNQVYGWTPDGTSVLFRSMRDGWDLTDTRLYTVPAAGGLPRALPMPVSGGGVLSPDGKKVVYSPLIRDFRTWKRYEGGWAQDLYIFDIENYETTPVAHHPRTERDPMWIGNKIYFSSDRNDYLNLYSFDVESGTVTQITDHAPYDVRWPSADEQGNIVYELNGQLHVLDTRTGKSSEIPIHVPDDGLYTRPSYVSVKQNIEAFGLSPKGERVIFVARGDVFTVPAEKGVTRNLTHSSNAHDREASWSPDGRKIVYISDRDGEEELYLVDYDGSSEPEQLTDGGSAMRYSPRWSPDSKQIAFSDKDGKLYVLTLDDRSVREVTDNPGGLISDYTWAPKGSYLAYSIEEPNGFNAIYIWNAADGKQYKASPGMFNSFNPAWDPAGNYLFFLSDRAYAPQVGSFEWNYVVDRETYIYALALREDVPNPFPPDKDEITLETEQADSDDRDEKKTDADSTTETFTIDFENLPQRITRVPVEADNYGGLSAVPGHLVFVRTGAFYYGRSSDVKPSILVYSLKDQKLTTLVEDIGGYTLSHDGQKILVNERSNYNLYSVTEGSSSKKTVSTDGLAVTRVPKEEWLQIFDEVWRRYRDFFYVENMHNYNWEELRERYRPLVAHVAHRSDLNYVIGEMISELNIGHAYITGGDYEIPDRPDVALLGARLELDEKTNRFRISTILEGDNAEDEYRSPLTEVGVNVHEGEYLLAIDGQPLTANVNPYRLLRHKARRPVDLLVNDTPEVEDARTVRINPVSSENNLLYLRWITRNRQMVDEMSGGRIGYIHIPDMGTDGIREFIKWYYPQIRKEGLVVDVRNNGGGNVSAMLIERLGRELLATGFSRTSDRPSTYPRTVFHGPMVCLLNENSASDGDIFPAMFREAGLGPLIGKRSWGGVTGITNRGTLIDGGNVNVPEFGFASKDGQWIIEGVGVDPDIVVENDPKSVLEGRDPQLERGVQETLKLMNDNPRKLPGRPTPPVKTPASL